jgi:hypothetical protein
MILSARGWAWITCILLPSFLPSFILSPSSSPNLHHLSHYLLSDRPPSSFPRFSHWDDEGGTVVNCSCANPPKTPWSSSTILPTNIQNDERRYNCKIGKATKLFWYVMPLGRKKGLKKSC